jgi:CBS domain containing-hemolysin-like protein
LNVIELAWTALVLSALAICFLAVVSAAVASLSRIALRALVERKEGSGLGLLPSIARDPHGFLLPVEFVLQLLLVVVGLLAAYLLVHSGVSHPWRLSLLALLGFVFLFRQLVPRRLTLRHPERVLMAVLPWFAGPYAVIRWVSKPLDALAGRAGGPRGEVENGDREAEEPTEEEIQAYLDVGEEEGIFEEEDSRLVQSALEFGDTVVRDIMTPRAEIVAIPETATVGELKEVMVSSKHSRIPVMRRGLDDVIGVVYVRQLLAHLDAAGQSGPIAPLVKSPWFVPETKRVAELLREMQHGAENLVLVINEYGAVSGLVTMEDLVEEIVGEIRDEDESLRSDLVYEGGGSYVARGALSLERLASALELEFGNQEAATVSGLIVANLQRIPRPGETFSLHGLEIEILSADRRRVYTLRIRKTSPPPIQE